MEWLNPEHHPARSAAAVRHVRVAAVQYQMRPITDFEEFAQQCEFFIDTASEYRMDFLLFPEMVTNQLPGARPGVSTRRLTARRLDEFTPRYVEFFTRMAMKYNLNIVGGSHLTVEDGKLYNIAYLFRRDGSVERQYKLHITPSEARWWGVSRRRRGPRVRHRSRQDRDPDRLRRRVPGGRADRRRQGREPAVRPVQHRHPLGLHARPLVRRRRAASRTACTPCSPARSATCRSSQGADIHYGEACILTPCDLRFARDGVAEEATPNVETMVLHELDIEVLRRNRLAGTVRTWLDRRSDLYKVRWSEKGKPREI